MTTRPPGELERVVLLALAAFDAEASGGEVYDAILSRTRRDPSLGAVYLTLARLAEKGWAAVRGEDPEPGRGGKRRKFYRLAPEGAVLLRRLRREFDALWTAADSHPLLAGDEESRG